VVRIAEVERVSGSYEKLLLEELKYNLKKVIWQIQNSKSKILANQDKLKRVIRKLKSALNEYISHCTLYGGCDLQVISGAEVLLNELCANIQDVKERISVCAG